MGYSSRKDPRMIAASERLDALLVEAARAAIEAREEFAREPRWCGLPHPNVHYPSTGFLLRHMASWSKVVDEQTGIAYHFEVIDAIIDYLRNRMPDLQTQWNQGSNGWTAIVMPEGTPRIRLDRIRGTLRHSIRLDASSMITVGFALLRPQKDRRYSRMLEIGKDVVRYEYVPVKREAISSFPAVVALAAKLREAFDHASVSLLPRKLSSENRGFLEWIGARGGECRVFELMRWIEQSPLRGRVSRHHQGSETSYLRTFCDKTGPKGSRAVWRVRPEALALLDSI